jgi:hypothetical protein
MKKLLSILLLFVSFGAFAQTYDTLPTGSKPYGNQLYLSPSGLIIGGTGSAKFRVIGTKKYVDSLLALKADLTALELYQTKANLSTDLTASATKYPNVNAVNAGLSFKANIIDVNNSLNTKANTSDVILNNNGSGTNTTLTGVTLAGTTKISTTPGDSFANFDFVTRDKNTGELKKIDQAIIPDLSPYQLKAEKGANNGYASLDGSGKVPLTQINDALLGAVNYRGTYNAATNSPALPTVGTSNKGYYWIVSTAGTQFGLDFRVGDWVISNGSSYGKVASSSDVESVNNKKGVVILDKNDIGLGAVDNTSDVVKPLSNAMNAALGLKANLSGGNTFTGIQTNRNNSIWNDGVNPHTLTAKSNGIEFTYLQAPTDIKVGFNANGHYIENTDGRMSESLNLAGGLYGGISFTKKSGNKTLNLISPANIVNGGTIKLRDTTGTIALLSDITSAGTGYLKPADVATGATIGANTTGSANLWQGLSRTAGIMSNPSQIGYLHVLNDVGNDSGFALGSTIKSWLNIGDGSTINNNAVSATNWGGYTAEFATLANNIDHVLVNQSGVAKPATASLFKGFLATSLQDATNVNNNTNNSLRITGENKLSGGAGLEMYYTSSGLGSITSYDRVAEQFKPLVLQGSYTNFANGNVGIGTNTPSEKLDVAGAGKFTTNINGTQLKAQSPQVAGLELSQLSNVDARTRNWGIFTNSSAYGSLEFGVGTSRYSNDYFANIKMSIDYGGNVGIGVLPTAKLHVNGDIKAQADGIGYTKPLILKNNSANPSYNGTSIEFEGFYKNARISAGENPTVSQGGLLQLQTYSNDGVNLNAGLTIDRVGDIYMGSTSTNTTINGGLKINTLAGTGNRALVATPNGTIQTGGTLGTVTSVQLSGGYGVLGTVFNSTTTPTIQYEADTASATGLVSKARLANTVSTGTYTPVASSAINAAGVTLFRHTYTKIGNVVTVYGKLSVAKNTTNPATFEITLPIASNFTDYYDLIGYGQSSNITSGGSCLLETNVTTKRAIVSTSTTTDTQNAYNYSFTYTIK